MNAPPDLRVQFANMQILNREKFLFQLFEILMHKILVELCLLLIILFLLVFQHFVIEADIEIGIVTL